MAATYHVRVLLVYGATSMKIWARVVAIDDGSHRIAIVSLDMIGLFYDDVVRIRNYIAQNINVDYVLIASTHTHNGPDLLGAWSPRPFAIDEKAQPQSSFA